MKHCNKCNITKELSEFYNDKSKKDGKASVCKSCKNNKGKQWRVQNKERVKELGREAQLRYKQTDNGKKTYQKYKKKWRENNRNKVNARNAVYRAVQSGAVKKPLNCSICSTKGPTEAHHHSYKKESWLDVIWLCKKCHLAIHNK